MNNQNLKDMDEPLKESANNDIQIIEIVYEKGNDNILIFYHLQQARENFKSSSYRK